MDQIELAYLLGAFKDGSVYKNDKEKIYRIRIYQKSKTMATRNSKVISKTFYYKTVFKKGSKERSMVS